MRFDLLPAAFVLAFLPFGANAAETCPVDVSTATVAVTTVNDPSVFEWYAERQHEIVFLNARLDYSVAPNPTDRIDQSLFSYADDESDGGVLRDTTFPVPTVREDTGRYAENYLQLDRDDEIRMKTASMGLRWSDLVGFYQIDVMVHSNATRIVELSPVPPTDIASYGACMRAAKAEIAAAR